MAPQAREPRLIDVLKDPIVRTLMDRDEVAEATVLDVMDTARRKFEVPAKVAQLPDEQPLDA
jgi:hypothetical protein